MDERESSVRDAIATLESDQPVDMQTLAMRFMQKRLENSKSIEDIRKTAIAQLSSKVNEESKPGFLLNVIEVLGDQSANDLNALMKSQSGGAGRTGGTSVSMFFGMPSEAGAVPAGPILPKEAYQQLDRLLIAADAVISGGWQPARVAEVVEATPIEPAATVRRPAPANYTPPKKKPAPVKKAAVPVKKISGTKKPAVKKAPVKVKKK